MEKIFLKIWNSPTIMTWGSFFSRSMAFFILMPLILTRFSTEEIALWYLFVTIISLQTLVDLGFSPTFIRILAFAMGGAKPSELKSPSLEKRRETDWLSVEIIFGTMAQIYHYLGLLWPVLLGAFGTLAVIIPISKLDKTSSGWIAWMVILGVSTITLRGNLYNAFLQGINHVALVRRWETILSLVGIATCALVLLSGGKILELVIAQQSWQVINVLRNKWLARRVENGQLKFFKKPCFDRDVFYAVWPSAWRSGVGVFMSYGLIHGSGVIFAQIGSSEEVASYLMALSLMQVVNQFSMAPFYSKIPSLARLYAENNRLEIVKIAKKGMVLAYWSFVIGFLGLGLLGEPLLVFIGSNADFPSHLLWTLMGIGFFVERYGAMHLQLFSITNNILWHIANGICGSIYIIVSFILFRYVGIYAFPIGIISGYLGFYAWYSARNSYAAFDLKFLSFETKTSLIPFLTILIYFLVTFQ